MNVVFCDGGLANRLNALLFCLVLRQKFGHSWEIAWPRNNWCRAALTDLFVTDIPVVEHTLEYYKTHEERYKLVMHENQMQFCESRIIPQQRISSYEEYQAILDDGQDVFYFGHLLPAFVTLEDLNLGMQALQIVPAIEQAARRFCTEFQIDDQVYGLHIRKTDFGDRVDDQALYGAVSQATARFFVCSDDPDVNERFSGLPNCHVFKKQHFPEKMVPDGGWNSWIMDDSGRQFPFNINRPGAAIAEALIDLLILSRTTLIQTSNSTFLNMALIFKGARFF